MKTVETPYASEERPRGEYRPLPLMPARSICIIAFLLSATLLLADSFTLKDGSKISGKVSRIDPDGISLITDSGVIKVLFEELPAEIQKRYNYDPQKAAERKAQFAEAQRKAAIHQQELQQEEEAAKKAFEAKWNAEAPQREAAKKAFEAAREEGAKKAAEFAAAENRRQLRASIKTIKEVETDLPGFLDKKFSIQGTIDVDNYYNYKFRGGETECYCFRIHDETGTAWGYTLRNEFGESLRKQILAAKGPLRGVFSVAMPSTVYTPGQGQALLVLGGVQPPIDD